jgi:phage repressor protein C with HTH and peptisase S24 domain
MRYQQIVAELEAGREVIYVGHGNSMTPRFKSGDRIRLVPVGTRKLKKGDAVLCKVGPHYYVHKITGIGDDGRYQISNNHGHVNGWTRKVYGIAIGVE